jgi:hypothetical protein
LLRIFLSFIYYMSIFRYCYSLYFNFVAFSIFRRAKVELPDKLAHLEQLTKVEPLCFIYLVQQCPYSKIPEFSSEFWISCLSHTNCNHKSSKIIRILEFWEFLNYQNNRNFWIIRIMRILELLEFWNYQNSRNFGIIRIVGILELSE